MCTVKSQERGGVSGSEPKEGQEARAVLFIWVLLARAWASFENLTTYTMQHFP